MVLEAITTTSLDTDTDSAVVEEVGESTPLVPEQETIPSRRLLKEAAFKERIVATTAGLSVLASFWIIFLELSAAISLPAVLMSGALGCILAPFAVLQQKKLTQIEALEQTNDAMEHEIADLTAENQRLVANVQELHVSVHDLPVLEETLATLQSIESRRRQMIIPQQLENDLDCFQQYITDHAPERQVGQVLRHLVWAMIMDETTTTDHHHHRRSNRYNDDRMLSDAEIDALIAAIDAIPGVVVHPLPFRDCIVEHGRSMTGLVHITRHLLRLLQQHDDDRMMKMKDHANNRTFADGDNDMTEEQQRIFSWAMQ